MDYKNIFLRIATSISLLCILFLFITKYVNYLNLIFYLIYIAIFFEIIIFFKKYNYIYLISLIYIFISFICLKYYFDYLFDLKIFLYTIIIISLFDVSSYIFGSYFGKSKMLPNISPNKTFFGFFSGIITTIMISYILNYAFNYFNFIMAIFFIFLILVSAFFGDILESIFKRNSNIKNSSKILPGHGGFFDRFDSFLMAINSLCLFSYFFKFYVNN